MRKRGAKPRRQVSRYGPGDRARIIAETIRDLQAKHIDVSDMAHLIFLLVHGHEPKSRVALTIARPHMDNETADAICREALGAFNTWGSSAHEGFQVVEAATTAIMDAVQNVRRLDRAFGETSLLCVHPSGAACLLFFADQGRDVHFMRRMVFDALSVPYDPSSARAPNFEEHV